MVSTPRVLAVVQAGGQGTRLGPLTRERATQIMLKVHTEGRGVCGVFPRDVASTKVEQVTAYSRQHQHPLQCAMEET